MKVAIDVLNQSPDFATGLLSLYVQLARNLPDRSTDIKYLFASAWEDVEYYQSKSSKIRVCGAGWGNRHRLLRVFSEHFILGSALKKEAPDIVLHCGGGIAPIHFPQKAKLILAIWGMHHLDQGEITISQRLYRHILFQHSLNRADVVLVNSQYTKDILCKNYKNISAPIVKIYHGVDLTLFFPDAASSTSRKSLNKFGISDKFILFVGQIYPYKLLHILVEGYCKLVHKERIKHKLLVVGSFAKMHGSGSGYHNMIVKILTRHNLIDQVVFVENVTLADLRAFYSLADLYVQPSSSETFGRTVIEAMACGCPVLAAHAAATPEILGDAGWYYETKSSDDCASKMGELLMDTTAREFCTAKGIERAKMFSFEQEMTELISLFRSMKQ